MGQALAATFPEAADYFQKADDILGFPLSRLCFEGPDEVLLKTENQQPAIFLVSNATNAVLQSLGLEAGAVAGHSLGEYSALVSSEALTFEEGLKLTRERGEQMAAIAARTGGIMAAILGLSIEAVAGACREAGSIGIVEIANFNSPVQTVIAGERDAVKRAMELALEDGARRVIELAVSAPFHCSLMAPLADSFGPYVATSTLTEPRVPFVSTVSADFETSPDVIRHRLIEQLYSPVRWVQSMQLLIDAGFDTFVEVGPGKVLASLMRSISPGARVLTTDNASELKQAVEGANLDT